MNKLSFIKILWSPFKSFKLKLYIGKIKIGVPYFFPRKTVKSKTKSGYLEFKPLKIGFSYCSLGYKTKWTDTDYRFEWSPVYSFVFFGYQIALIIEAPNDSHAYWESWLYYELQTDKTKSKKERIKQCIKEFPQIYTIYHKIPKTYKETVNKYEYILKSKYNKIYDKTDK